MILIVGNTKGGVGKTTLAFQLALARALAGRDVLLVDADRQGSAQDAVSIRAEAGHAPALACVAYPEGSVLRQQLGLLAGKHADTIIDAGGRDSEALRVGLVRADALLVPVQPRAVDVWALRDIAELVTQAQESRADDGRKPLRALAGLNLADPGANADTQDALAALASYPQLVPVAEPIRRRKAVANAMAHGLAVAELLPRDAKACAEMAALTEAVFAIKEQSYGNHAASKPKQVG
jgi:chromosome partitioning protein